MNRARPHLTDPRPRTNGPDRARCLNDNRPCESGRRETMTYRTLASRPKLAGIWKFGGCTQARIAGRVPGASSRCGAPRGATAPSGGSVGPGGSAAARLQDASQFGDLVVVLQGLAAGVRDREAHLIPVELDLQVVLLGFIAGGAQALEHVHDVPPVDVVRRGMREELREGVFVAVAHVVLRVRSKTPPAGAEGAANGPYRT